MGVVELIVVVLVVGARLLLPLLIPYFPAPALLACLVLDAADETIFQQFPKIPLDAYQSYDKALDIYYLAIAYLSVFRNWTNRPAVLMAAFLFYYRLVGALLFELTHERWLLFVFPNTFEYFFLFFVLCLTVWRQDRISTRVVIWSTALIWVVIKLPQEWWIHIAKLDFTDFIAAHTWVVAPMVVVAAVVIGAGWWVVTRRAPPPDHRFTLRAAPLPPQLADAELYRGMRARERLLDRALAQKAALTALLTVIFTQFLVSGASALQTAVSVVVFVILNAFVSQWLARRGRSWRSTAIEFAVMAAVNFGLALGLETFEYFVGIRSIRLPTALTLFLVFLLTVLIVLFDRYHTVFVARRLLGGRGSGSEASHEGDGRQSSAPPHPQPSGPAPTVD